MFTLCVILKSGLTMLIDVLSAQAALFMTQMLRGKGARVHGRFWAK